MLPPVQGAPLSSRVLVQLDTEIPEVPGKIARGVFDFLARSDLRELPPGSAPIPGTAGGAPAAYFCWSTRARGFVRMRLAPGEWATLAARIDKAYALAGCRLGG
jgi:hypothetical protein